MKTRILMCFLAAMLTMMLAAATGPPALSGSTEQSTLQEQLTLGISVVALSIPACPGEILLQDVTQTASQSPMWMSPATKPRESGMRATRPRIRLPTGIG